MNIKRILLSAAITAGIALSSTGCSLFGQSGSSGNIEDITFADGDKIAVIEIKDYGTVKAKLFPDIAPVGVENFIQLAEQGYYDGLKIHRVIKDSVMQGGSLNGDGTGGSAVYTSTDKNQKSTGSFGIETSEKARNFYGALGYAADEYGQNATQFYIVNNKTPQDIRKTSGEKVQSRADELASQAAAATWEADSADAKLNAYQQAYYKNNAKMLTSPDQAVIDKYAKVGGIYQIDGGYTVFGQVYEGFDVIDSIADVAVETNAFGEKSMPVTDIIISSVTIETYKASTAEASDTSSDSKTTSSKANNNLIQNSSSAASDTSSSQAESDSSSQTSSDVSSQADSEILSTVDTKEQ